MQRRDFVKTGLAAGGAALSVPNISPLWRGPAGNGAFVHCVYFWLKDGLTNEQTHSFESGLDSLVRIDSVRLGFYGSPASTDRPIIDRTYSYALVVVFDDQERHDAYQVDAVHDVFRETYGDMWEEVKIYDFIAG